MTGSERDEGEWAAFAAGLGGTASDYALGDFARESAPVATGIPGLDRVLGGGLRPGVTVIGGEPGAGKSALGLQVALNVALRGERAVYVSLEMDRGQCWRRLASCYASMRADEGKPVAVVRWADGWRYATGAMTAAGGGNAFKDALRNVTRDAPGVAVAGAEYGDAGELAGMLRRAFSLGAALAVVDYLQLVRAGGEGATEYQAVTAASREITRLASECGAPVVALSSLARAQGARAQGAPDMHGFRGSGGIEYDATAAIVMRRTAEVGATAPRAPIVELHVLKDREGEITQPDAPVRVQMDGAHSRCA